MSTWTTEFYEEASGACPIEAWMDDLDPVRYAALTAAITHVLEPNGIDLARTEWLKPLKEGLWEFRVRHTAREIISMYGDANEALPADVSDKVLLRIFVTFHGAKVILLLSGYDKGDDPSARKQQREIAKARKMLRAWKAAGKKRR